MVALMDRLRLFPDTTKIENDSLTIADRDLAALAEQHGTPLYVYDRLTLDNAVAAYESALKQHYPGSTQITYAGKAFLCLAIAQWTKMHDLWLDCTGEGELAIAVAARMQPERVAAVKGSTPDRVEYDPRANSSAGQLITWVFIGFAAFFYTIGILRFRYE